MENILKILNLLTQRRVWIFIISSVSFLLSVLKIEYKIDIPVLGDMLTVFGVALVNFVTAGLAVWSYLKPKKS